MCEICNKLMCDSRCPNYNAKTSEYKCCSVCEEEIAQNEEYIVNTNGEYIHFECIKGIRWLLKWLGYDIITTEKQEKETI